MNEQLQAKLLQVGTAHRMAACSTLAREASNDRWVACCISRTFFARIRDYIVYLVHRARMIECTLCERHRAWRILYNPVLLAVSVSCAGWWVVRHAVYRAET